MTTQPTLDRSLQLSIGLWILAGTLTLFAATANGPFGGGFSWVDLAARVVGLVAAVQSLAAILAAANAAPDTAEELRAPASAE